ncbi:MAG: hypothetical protein DI536_36000 [Archangium gephyra]|uniref:Lipoprotein n=1 Tax=Archangium gephyra TaxID=48 RepID=A0A2W5UJI3_9BACT|nr:MAG: hypothetical protein DI536_36000 [Archangium gephyra]
MKWIVLAACAVAVTAVGCTAGDSSPDAGVSNCDRSLPQKLTRDTTLLAKCSPYSVERPLTVDGFTLTIEPGVEVRFFAGAQLEAGVRVPGKVIARGTREKPISLKGSPWNGVALGMGAAGSVLENVSIEDAGSVERPALSIGASDVTLKNVRVVNAKRTALSARVDAPLKTISGLELTGDPAELVHLDVSTAGVFSTGATLPPDAVIWLHGGLTTDVTLTDIATWRVPQTLNVDAPEGKTASLTLKEGVRLELGERAALEFGYTRGPATFRARGTREKPAIITRYGDDPMNTPSNGLRFFGGARAPEIDWLVVEYAGALERPAVFFNGSRGLGRVTNSVFRHMKSGAICIEAAQERFVAFDGNTFEDIEGTVLRAPLELAHNISPKNSFPPASRIEIFGSASRDTTLTNLWMPYFVSGALTANAGLTLERGTTLLFDDAGTLNVSAGKLTARDATFAKAKTGWRGIEIAGTTTVKLENVTIAGVDDWALSMAPTVSGSVKKLNVKGAKKGVRSCAKKVKRDAVTPAWSCE